MKVYENGTYRDMTEGEMKQKADAELALPYEQRVVNRIREKYSVNDELALLRQRDTKTGEFNEYNAFVEGIKAEEKEGAKNYG